MYDTIAVFGRRDHSMSHGQSSLYKPGSPSVRTLYNPYIVPFTGHSTVAHMGNYSGAYNSHSEPRTALLPNGEALRDGVFQRIRVTTPYVGAIWELL